MSESQLPQTDSIRELAEFWQAHDLADFEEELEEVSKSVFDRDREMQVPFTSSEIEVLKDMARSKLEKANEDPDSKKVEDSENPILYVEELKRLTEGAADASRSLDRTLITLSSGALGLSITFVRFLAPTPHHIWVLAGAWICFGATLILMLISFLMSRKAFEKAVKSLNLVYEKQDSEARKINHWQSKWIDRFNLLSTISFIIGAIMLASFTWINLPTV